MMLYLLLLVWTGACAVCGYWVFVQRQSLQAVYVLIGVSLVFTCGVFVIAARGERILLSIQSVLG